MPAIRLPPCFLYAADADFCTGQVYCGTGQIHYTELFENNQVIFLPCFFSVFSCFFAAFVLQCRMRGKDAVFMSADNVISYI